VRVWVRVRRFLTLLSHTLTLTLVVKNGFLKPESIET
jgi:hypothetical protein